MHVREPLAARALASLCLAAGAAAQDDAPWLLARHADATGNTAFPSAAIRDEVASNLRIADGLLRAHDAEERAQVIADCVADGYRRAGFVDVAVRAERVDSGLLLRIVEGPRCRTGAV